MALSDPGEALAEIIEKLTNTLLDAEMKVGTIAQTFQNLQDSIEADKDTAVIAVGLAKRNDDEIQNIKTTVLGAISQYREESARVVKEHEANRDAIKKQGEARNAYYDLLDRESSVATMNRTLNLLSGVVQSSIGIVPDQNLREAGENQNLKWEIEGYKVRLAEVEKNLSAEKAQTKSLTEQYETQKDIAEKRGETLRSANIADPVDPTLAQPTTAKPPYVTKVEKLEDNVRKLQQQNEQLTRSNRELQNNNDKLKKDLEDCLAKHRTDSPTPVVQTRQSKRQADRQASTATQKTSTGTLGRKTFKRGLTSVRNVFRRSSTPDADPSPGSIGAPGNVSSAVSSNVASKTASRPSSAFGIGPESTTQPGSTAAAPFSAAMSTEPKDTPQVLQPRKERSGLGSPFEPSSSDLRRAPPTSTVTGSESTTSLGKHGRQTGDTPKPQVWRRTEDGAVPRETTLILPPSRSLPSSGVPQTSTLEDTDMYGAPPTRRDPATTSAGAEEELVVPQELLQSEAAAESSQTGRDDSQDVSGGSDRPTEAAQGNAAGQAETEETAEQAAALAQARRVGTAPPRRYPGETVWQGPPVQDPSNLPNANMVYNAVHLPRNWDARANDQLIAHLTNLSRRFGAILEDFHIEPPCLATRIARKQTEFSGNQPCTRCSDRGDVCIGLKVAAGVVKPQSSYNSKKHIPRMEFERNTDGYYWEASYRPARGPDPDNGGDGNGGQGSSTGGMVA